MSFYCTAAVCNFTTQLKCSVQNLSVLAVVSDLSDSICAEYLYPSHRGAIYFMFGKHLKYYTYYKIIFATADIVKHVTTF